VCGVSTRYVRGGIARLPTTRGGGAPVLYSPTPPSASSPQVLFPPSTFSSSFNGTQMPRSHGILRFTFPTHRPRRPFPQHASQAAVYTVAYSPNGDCIASGSKDRTIRLWAPSVEGKSTVLKVGLSVQVECSRSIACKRMVSTLERTVWKTGSSLCFRMQRVPLQQGALGHRAHRVVLERRAAAAVGVGRQDAEGVVAARCALPADDDGAHELGAVRGVLPRGAMRRFRVRRQDGKGREQEGGAAGGEML
jgi:hypothetical protein